MMPARPSHLPAPALVSAAGVPDESDQAQAADLSGFQIN